MIWLSTRLWMCNLYRLFILCLPTCLAPHLQNCLISQFLYMETIYHLSRSGKAYMGCLFHIGGHVKCDFLTWKRLRLESFSRIEVTVFTSVAFIIAIILPVRPLCSLFIRMVYSSPRERHLHLFLHKLRYFSQIGAILLHVRVGFISNNCSGGYGIIFQAGHRQHQTEDPEVYSLPEDSQYKSFKKDANSCVIRLPWATSFQLRLT